jgi:hypothetical protein
VTVPKAPRAAPATDAGRDPQTERLPNPLDFPSNRPLAGKQPGCVIGINPGVSSALALVSETRDLLDVAPSCQRLGEQRRIDADTPILRDGLARSKSRQAGHRQPMTTTAPRLESVCGRSRCSTTRFRFEGSASAGCHDSKGLANGGQVSVTRIRCGPPEAA